MQAPYELEGLSEASLVVTVNGQQSDSLTIPIVPTRPSLFPRIWNEDGTVNSLENPAYAGSIVVLYATGQGVTNPPRRTGAFPVEVYPEPQATTSLRIGGVDAELMFRGQAPGTAGVMQVNARVPHNLASGTAVPIVLSVGGSETQATVVLATH